MLYRILKRSLDIIIAVIVLIICSPLLIPIVIGLKLTGEGYVFYFQERIGYKNKPFSIWKFATMLKDSPNMKGGVITLRNDPRVTPMGTFLRKTKINELPQIINVLLGNMSVVGPRPLASVTYNAYSDDIKASVYNCKPGITGIGSIIFRDEERLVSVANMDPHIYYKEKIAPYKGSLELWYQQNASIYTDLTILFLTIWVIIFPQTKLPFTLLKNLPPLPQHLS